MVANFIDSYVKKNQMKFELLLEVVIEFWAENKIREKYKHSSKQK